MIRCGSFIMCVKLSSCVCVYCRFRWRQFSLVFFGIFWYHCQRVGSRFEFAFVNICACKKGSCDPLPPPSCGREGLVAPKALWAQLKHAPESRQRIVVFLLTLIDDKDRQSFKISTVRGCGCTCVLKCETCCLIIYGTTYIDWALMEFSITRTWPQLIKPNCKKTSFAVAAFEITMKLLQATWLHCTFNCFLEQH